MEIAVVGKSLGTSMNLRNLTNIGAWWCYNPLSIAKVLVQLQYVDIVCCARMEAMHS